MVRFVGSSYIIIIEISILMKPYIKGKCWIITKISLDDKYFLVVIIQLG